MRIAGRRAAGTDPQDARPDEMDIAVLADRISRETLIPVRRIAHSGEGLRAFVPDGAPVVGLDTQVPDFCWLAGQGGYGIMMAPVLADIAATICTGADVTEMLAAMWLDASALGT